LEVHKKRERKIFLAASEKDPFKNDFLLLVAIREDDDANLSGM